MSVITTKEDTTKFSLLQDFCNSKLQQKEISQTMQHLVAVKKMGLNLLSQIPIPSVLESIGTDGTSFLDHFAKRIKQG